ncbi:MAG: hypothetical protein GY907_00660 [Bacteroidetes bacterium]|nr:hypothetical protein [Bacteroidota bacterium]
MNADDLLSTQYDEFSALMLNEDSDLDVKDLDTPTVFDIPVMEFLMTQLEGGKIMNRDAVINFLENQILLAAQAVAEEIN